MVGKRFFTVSVIAIALSLLLLAFPTKSTQAIWYSPGAPFVLTCASGSCTGGVSGNPYAPGQTADLGLRTTWTSQSANFAYGYIASFFPADWKITPGTALTRNPQGGNPGNKGGVLISNSTLGMTNGQCDTNLNLVFDLYVANADTSQTFTVAADRSNVDLDDAECYPTAAGNGIRNDIDCYPHFNNIMFDPDGNGPTPPLKPRARLTGWTWVGASRVMIQYLIFNPGQMQVFDPPQAMSQFGAELGYPAIIILQNPSEPEMPNAVTTFCTPSLTSSDLYGKNAAGETQFQNPAAGTGLRNASGVATDTHLFGAWSATGRDISAFGAAVDPGAVIQADQMENKIDTCPLKQNADDQHLTTGADTDMIDPVCDDGRNGSDVDTDYFMNANDNCPLITNVYPQKETEWQVMPPPADGGPFQDSIGDKCEVTLAGASWDGGDWNGDNDTTDPYEQYLNKYYSQGAFMSAMAPWPIPLSATLSGGWPNNDTDKDGWTDTAEAAYGSNPAVNGSGDQDGDTIPNVAGTTRCNNGQTTSCSDNCPIDYNPSQADTWGILRIGDVCELAGPPAWDVTSSHAHPANDYDADGSLNDADPCPQFKPGGNPLQDTDGDGIGDSCDPMPAINYSPFGRPEHRALQFAMALHDVGAKPLPSEKPKITYLHNFELAGHAPKPQPPMVDPLQMTNAQVEGSGWYELWPYWKRTWTVNALLSNGNGYLDTSDLIQVTIDDGIFDPVGNPAAENGWYHVEAVTVTIEVTKHDPSRPDADNKLKRTLELEGATTPAQMNTAIHSPLSTKWLEWDSSFNTHGERYNLSSWTDNGDLMLSLGDDIVLEDLYIPGEKYTYHVTQVGIDATVVRLDIKGEPGSPWANPGMNGVEQLCDDYIDNDGDGLTDLDEANCGQLTNDSDNDGLKDTGAVGVKDNCKWAPNQSQTDTDADGKGDACDPDDDGDGYLDAYEWALGTNPLSNTSPGGPAPTTDTDGDGFLDNLEIHQGVDPNSACTGGTDAWSGDINLDTVTDVLDLLAFPPSKALLTAIGHPNFNRRYDMNGDNNVDVLDLLAYPPRGVLMTQCRILSFHNTTGAGVNDIHVKLTPVSKLFTRVVKAWDEDGILWNCVPAIPPAAPANVIDCTRASGTLDASKEIFISVQFTSGSAVDLNATTGSYWSLNTVKVSVLVTVMERTTARFRNDTQGPVDDIHLVLAASKLIYKVFTAVDSDKKNWTCTTIPWPGGLNAIDCTRATGDGDLEYKGTLTIDWKIDFKAAIAPASSYWTFGGTNVGPITIIKPGA